MDELLCRSRMSPRFPQVPAFQTVDSPMPPHPTTLDRSWSLAEDSSSRVSIDDAERVSFLHRVQTKKRNKKKKKKRKKKVKKRTSQQTGMSSSESSNKRPRLPQVPAFQTVDSPMPPHPTTLDRSWSLAEDSSPRVSIDDAEQVSSTGYGSDNDEDELAQMSAEQLRFRCTSLMRAAARMKIASSPRNPPQTLSPAMYSVHSRRQGGVKRLQLGRSASIATRDELTRLGSHEHSAEDENLWARLNNVMKAGSSAYTSSGDFADDILTLCAKISPVFQNELRVLELKSPIYVFGDTHGNMEDLKFFADNVWPLGMSLTAGGFLFLGDYVDRGHRGLEVLAYLFAQKVQNPFKLFLLRGNHETRSVNGWEEYYGNASFLAQCKDRFGPQKGSIVWEECNRVFDRMPLAAIIDRSIFCVHGGIPRPPADPNAKDSRLDEIRKIPCPIEVKQPSIPGTDAANRLAFSLLWSDPADSGQEPYLERETGFGSSVRGSGSVVFGTKAVEQFLKNFGLGYIMRAHEATASGVAVSKSAKVLTVFSTSKDHGCGGEAKCGCVLVDVRRIVAITRSPDYSSQPTNSPNHASMFSSSPNSGGGGEAFAPFSSHSLIDNYNRPRANSIRANSTLPQPGRPLRRVNSTTIATDAFTVEVTHMPSVSEDREGDDEEDEDDDGGEASVDVSANEDDLS